MKIALFAVLLVASTVDARPCTCVCGPGVPVERSIADASVIAVGTVLEIKSKSTDRDPDDGVDVVSSCGQEWVRVEVVEMLKGKPRAEIAFVHGSVGTACDFRFSFHEGGQYLLFGFVGDDDATMYISGCSPSAPRRSASKLIKKIRKQLVDAS